MTAENIYLFLFFVGVLFTAGNLAISGLSHVFGGIGGHTADGTGGADSGGADAGGADFHDAGGIDSHGADFHGVDTGMGGHSADGIGGADFHGAGGADFHGVDTGVGGHSADGIGGVGGTDGIGGAGLSLGSKNDMTLGGGRSLDADGQAHSADGAAHYTDSAIHHAGDSVHPAGASPHHADARHPALSTSKSFNPLSLLTTWLPLRPTALICFAAVTGGAGTILIRLGWSGPLSHIIPITSGYGLSMLLGVVLPKRLRRAQNTSAAERYELIGIPATVTSAILENGFGRIAYTARENAFSAPARHVEGRRVPQGARVVICEIKDNVYYVTELNI